MRLPDDAWIRSTPASREQARKAAAWPVPTELAALAVDLLAVIAAEQRIKKPFDVPRPGWLREQDPKAGIKRAVAILKAHAGPGRTRVFRQGTT